MTDQEQKELLKCFAEFLRMSKWYEMMRIFPHEFDQIIEEFMKIQQENRGDKAVYLGRK